MSLALLFSLLFGYTSHQADLLAADGYEDRERAEHVLHELHEAAIPALWAVMSRCGDPEAICRSKRLLTRLETRRRHIHLYAVTILLLCGDLQCDSGPCEGCTDPHCCWISRHNHLLLIHLPTADLREMSLIVGADPDSSPAQVRSRFHVLRRKMRHHDYPIWPD